MPLLAWCAADYVLASHNVVWFDYSIISNAFPSVSSNQSGPHLWRTGRPASRLLLLRLSVRPKHASKESNKPEKLENEWDHLFMLPHEVLDVSILALLRLVNLLLAPQLCIVPQSLYTSSC